MVYTKERGNRSGGRGQAQKRKRSWLPSALLFPARRSSFRIRSITSPLSSPFRLSFRARFIIRDSYSIGSTARRKSLSSIKKRITIPANRCPESAGHEGNFLKHGTTNTSTNNTYGKLRSIFQDCEKRFFKRYPSIVG